MSENEFDPERPLVEQLPEELKNRLREEELGTPYLDVKGGAEVSDRGSRAEYVVSNISKERDELSFGSIVSICDLESNQWYGGRVIGMEQHWPYETDKQSELMDYSRDSLFESYAAHGGNLYSGKLVTELELLSTFDFEGTVFSGDSARKPVSSVPSPASVMLLPRQNQDFEPSLSQILDIPESGLDLALYASDQEFFRDSDGVPLTYNLQLEEMENKHVFMAGTTGAGKTVALKHFTKQALLEDYSVYAFDIQGDIIQMLLPYDLYKEVQGEDATGPKKGEEDIQKTVDSVNSIYEIDKKVTFLYPLVEDTRVDGRTQKLREMMNHMESEYDAQIDFKKFSLEFSSVETAEQLQLFLPYLSDQAPDLLRRLFREFHRKLSKQPSIINNDTLEEFVEWCEVVKNTDNTDGQYLYPEEIDGYSVHKSTFDNLLRNLEVLQDEEIFDIATEPSWITEPDRLYLIYLYELEDAIRHKYEYHIMSQLYNKRDRHVAKNGVYTIIDEGHRVIPRKSHTYEQEFLDTVSREFMKIGREGRKYDLNLLISTQKPQDIHQVVYDMTSTKLAFRLSKEDARDMGVSKEYQTLLPSFDTGNTIIRSPENCRVPWVELKTVMPKIPHENPQEFFDQLDDYLDHFKQDDEPAPDEMP